MSDEEYFRITGTIKRARARLENLDSRLENINALHKIEVDNIDRLNDILSAPMSVNIIEDIFDYE